MRHLVQLFPDRLIQDRMIVTVDVGPDRRVAVKVASAETIFQPRSAPGNQHEWLVIGRNPVVHLRERMPDMRFVELDEGVHWAGVRIQESGARSLTSPETGGEDSADRSGFSLLATESWLASFWLRSPGF